MTRWNLVLAWLLAAFTALPAQAYDVVDKELQRGPFARVKVGIGGYLQPRLLWIQPDPGSEDGSFEGTDDFLGFEVQRARFELTNAFLAPKSSR